MSLRFPDGELAAWLCLGAITDRTVRVWIRAPEPTESPLSVALESSDGQADHLELTCEPEHDWVAVGDLEVQHPAPGTPFTVTMGEHVRAARFAPSPGDSANFSFGFGSCHQPFRAAGDDRLIRHAGAAIYRPMCAELQRRSAEFLLLIGDQVYSDGTDGVDLRDWMQSGPTGRRSDDELVAAYRQLYRGYFNETGFRSLLEHLPSYLIWDDHDISDSWGSRFSESDDDQRLFRAARRAYREYQHPHNPGSVIDHEGAHQYGFVRGNVGFLVLDLRNDRSWSDGVVLGDRQWAYVDGFLTEMSEREIATVFLVSSIPLIHFPPTAVRLLQWLPGGKGSDVRDRWDATPFREQRDALIGRLGSWQRGGGPRQVVVLSGDVHAAAAFRVQDRQTGGVFHQWTSSSLSAPGGPVHDFVNWAGPRLANWGERRCRVSRIGADWRNNFGVVGLTALPGGGHEVTLDVQVRSRGGAIRRGFGAVARPASE